MLTLIYLIDPADATAEKTWLKEMQVFPGTEDYVDWTTSKQYVRFCVIVSPDAALAIKLRHPLQIQAEYRQR